MKEYYNISMKSECTTNVCSTSLMINTRKNSIRREHATKIRNYISSPIPNPSKIRVDSNKKLFSIQKLSDSIVTNKQNH